MFACAGTPSISTYAGMIARAPASLIAARNGGKKISRITRSEIVARAGVDARLRLAVDGEVLQRRHHVVGVDLCRVGLGAPCSPRTAATPMRDTRYGSSP